MPQDEDHIAQSLQVKHDLETRLIERCWRDPEFRRRIVADPKGMLERFLGKNLPDRIKIFVHEDNQDTMHLTIPPAPANQEELSDDDLERIAGGTEFAVGVTILVAATAASFSIERTNPRGDNGTW